MTTVLEAFETLFNKRDYAAAERFWSPNYIQHSAHIAPGRDGLFGLIKSLPHTLKYEHDMMVAAGKRVIVSRTLFRFPRSSQLDSGRHPRHGGRGFGRALECH